MPIREQVAALREWGHTIADIAELWGLSWVEVYDLTLPRLRDWSDDQRAESGRRLNENRSGQARPEWGDVERGVQAAKIAAARERNPDWGTRRIDHTGERFGKLTVIRWMADQKWLCRCDCGQDRLIDGHQLRSGCRSCLACHLTMPRVKICRRCGAEFEARTPRQVYCGCPK